jgi:hypothetical protein
LTSPYDQAAEKIKYNTITEKLLNKAAILSLLLLEIPIIKYRLWTRNVAGEGDFRRAVMLIEAIFLPSAYDPSEG